MNNQRVALVTGGSRGIGRAIAIRLATDGCDVALNYAANEDAAREVVNAIKAVGREAIMLKGDLAEPTVAAQLVSATTERWGRLDVVVNNAGISSNESAIADTDPALWSQMLDINLNGTFHMVRAAVPIMRQQGSGNIVNLSSNVTQRMPASFGAYTVSKSAVEALTRILAKEEGPNGIRVNAVAPGPIRTEMLESLLDKMGTERAQAFVRSVPIGRIGEPEEIAAMISMLVSEVASFVTGQVIYVNGGGPGG